VFYVACILDAGIKNDGFNQDLLNEMNDNHDTTGAWTK
jgi:hypothetical protein